MISSTLQVRVKEGNVLIPRMKNLWHPCLLVWLGEGGIWGLVGFVGADKVCLFIIRCRLLDTAGTARTACWKRLDRSCWSGPGCVSFLITFERIRLFRAHNMTHSAKRRQTNFCCPWKALCVVLISVSSFCCVLPLGAWYQNLRKKAGEIELLDEKYGIDVITKETIYMVESVPLCFALEQVGYEQNARLGRVRYTKLLRTAVYLGQRRENFLEWSQSCCANQQRESQASNRVDKFDNECPTVLRGESQVSSQVVWWKWEKSVAASWSYECELHYRNYCDFHQGGELCGGGMSQNLLCC